MKESEWHDLNRRVIARDGGRCFKCPARANLEVHHIIPLRFSHDDSMDNLITLCPSCHRKADIAYLKYGATHFTRMMLNAAIWRSTNYNAVITAATTKQ